MSAVAEPQRTQVGGAVSIDEVKRRLQEFNRTRNPEALWPGLTERARVAAAHEVERVTRAVLDGRVGEVIDPTDAHSDYALAIAGHTTGMAPLLGYWIETGIVHSAPAVAARFATYLEHARRRSARMEREVGPALDALSRAGLEPVVLKGFHTARVYFNEPALRRMADVDVFVAPQRVEAAEAALTDAGFQPVSSALRPYKREWIGAAVDRRVYSLELPDERTRWTLELHGSLDRTFHPGVVARLDGEMRCVTAQTIADRRLLALDQPLLMLTLAIHCSQELDGSRLLRLFEMAQVIRIDRAAGRFDWDAFLSMVERTGAARFTFPALSLVEQLAPGTIDQRVLRLGRRHSTWAARHTVARLVPAGGSIDQRGVIRQLMWIRSPLSIAQRILRTLWPTSFTGVRGLRTGWQARARRMRTGLMTLGAPNERANKSDDGVGS